MGEHAVFRKYAVATSIFALFILVALLLVHFHFDGKFHGHAWMKMALATGYLAAALAMGALDSRLGRWLLLGFACAWWGDFLLIGPKNPFFLAGLIAFLLGHVCYCAAYAAHGARWRVAGVSYLVLACPGAVLAWNLWPGIPAGMHLPVMLYLAVITLMVALSFGCVRRPGGWLLALGAVLFYLSDMGVSSHAFGGAHMEPFKRLVALYFPGQYVLALAIPVARRAAGKVVHLGE
jgi:uncharacterized membrane protein YhhN